MRIAIKQNLMLLNVGKRAQRPRCRPFLEFLEDRTVLSPTLFTVTSAGNDANTSCTLPYAVKQANNNTNADGSLIQFSSLFNSPQTISLSSCLVLQGKVPITITGPGADKLTITGPGASNNFSAFYVYGQTASISEVTIANMVLNLSGRGGAGIYNTGNLTLSDVSVTNNWSQTGNGGGIYSTGTLTLTDVTISGNISLDDGGGVYNDNGTVTMTDSTLSGNTALNGGGIENTGKATLTNVIVSGNLASGGTTSGFTKGGGISNSGTLTVMRCLVSDNNAIATDKSNMGAAIFSYGGGIENENTGTAFVINTTITGNSARETTPPPQEGASCYGGGVDNQGTATLTNITIDANSALGYQTGLMAGGSFGGGLMNWRTLTLNNSIVAGDNINNSHLQTVKGDIYGTVTSGFNNLLEDSTTTGGLKNGSNGNITGKSPLLGPLQDNGGPTETMALLTGSPAIDAGSVPLAVDANGDRLLYDQRGPGFQRIFGQSVDIGAYELQQGPPSTPTLTVDTTNDESDGSDGKTSLREALANAATMTGNQTITFASGLTGMITLGAGLTISSNVTISGPGASVLTVAGGGASSDFSVFTVSSGVTATISGLTITDGNTSGSSYGGGVLNHGTLTLMGDVISGNSSGSGGGILNASSATLIGCTLYDNTATTSGGAVYNGDNTTLNLINDTITADSASCGGGVFSTGTATLTNVTLSGDPSSESGALDNSNQGVMTLNNTIVASQSSGGDISGTVSGSNNLIDDTGSTGGLTGGVQGNLVGVAALLGPLGNYGGPTQTLPLLPGSPAVDAGSVALAVDAQNNPLTTDQRGMNRVVGSSVDIGAFESSGFTLTVSGGNTQSTAIGSAFPDPLQVTVAPINPGDPVNGGVVTFSAPANGASATLNPSGPVAIAAGTASVTATANGVAGGPYSVTAMTTEASQVLFFLTNTESLSLVVNTLADSPTSGTTTLRQALANAATLGGNQTITFASGLTGTIALSSGLEISSNVTITGPGPSLLTVSGGGASSDFSVFTVDSRVTAASISGLTIAGGNMSSSNSGGGILNLGMITLSGDLITGDSAGFGGGVFNAGIAVLAGCTLSANSAVNSGGAVYNYSNSTLTLVNDTITGDSAAFAGALLNTGNATLTNVTVAADQTTSSGALYNYGTSTMTLNNTIVANSAQGGDLTGTVSGSNNLIDDEATSGGLSNSASGNIVGVSALLGPFGSYGGPTQTLPLLPGSPAIDAGNSSLAVDAQGNALTPDQRGMPRVVGAAVDIGAFETSGFTLSVSAGNNQSTGVNTSFSSRLQVTVAPKNLGDPVNGGVVTFSVPGSGASATLNPSGSVTITSGTASVTATANSTAGSYTVKAATTGAASASLSLTNTNTGSGSLVVTTLSDSPTSGFTTLRQALANAAALGGSQTVSFSAGLTGTIALSSTLEISSNVIIAGPGAPTLSVSGGGASSDFSVFTADSGVTATISGLTITGGHRSGTNVGGGIDNSGTLTLTGDVITGNSAGFGGGILNAATAIVVGCTISGNEVTYSGGGIYSGDGSVLRLINDTITADSAYYGGGVFDTGAVTLTNVTLAADPTNSGGALYEYAAGTATLNNTIVANRTSGGDIAGTVAGSNNLIDDATTAGGLSNGVSGNVVGVSALLGPLGNYGGPTQTLPLLPGSPAIDAGNSSLAVDSQGKSLTTDQRGMARVVGISVDIGAFESSGFTLSISAGNNQSTAVSTAFSSPLQVTVAPKHPGDPVNGGVVTFAAAASGASATLNPAGPVTISSDAASVTATANSIVGSYVVTASTTEGTLASFSLTNTSPLSLVVNTLADSAAPGFTTLRQALANAATLGGSQTINFAAGLTGTITLTSTLEINSNVTITGPGPASLIVSGGGASSNFNVFVVDGGVTATISGLTIANAHTTDPSGSGGIYNSGDLALASDVFTGNSGSYGGAILNWGTAVLTGCTLSGDSAANGGGGVCNGGTITLINDTIAGESAGYGSGVFNFGAATLTNVSLAADPSGSGGAAVNNYSAGTLTLNNTIVANRSNGGDIAGTVSGSNNLIDDAATAGGLTDGVSGNLVGLSALLGTLGNYGGPTQTLPLLPGSPAIDAGSSSLAVDAQNHELTTDQRGMARVVGTAVDIGAFESSGFTLSISAGNNQSTEVSTTFSSPLQVTVAPKNPGDPVNGGVVTFTGPGSGASATLSPSGPVTITKGVASVTATANGTSGGPYAVTAVTTGGPQVQFFLTNTESLSLVVNTLADSAATGVTTLRQALTHAATLGGSQTVSFASGLSGKITLSSTLEISSNVTIAGPGPSPLTVSGGGASSDFNVFVVDSGVTATISGLTIAGGNSSSVNAGGGVLNFGTLTLAGDVVSGNSAGYGGAIYNVGTAVVTNCTLSANSATDSGGAVYSQDGSTLTLINDTITGNTAAYGGGVFSTGTATLTNVTLAADPTTSAGALYNYGAGTMTLNNTIVANRTAGGDITGAVSGSYNLVDDSATAGGLTASTAGNLVGVDAVLGPLGSYGGPTQTLPLLPGSPAIDAGNSSLAVDAQGKSLSIDQRGMPRVVGASVDIGAFESSGFTLAVSAGNNQSTGIETAFSNSLRVAITPKNSGDPVNGGELTFTAPASGASATLSPTGPVTITSGTASVVATANGIPGGPYAVTVVTPGAAPVSFSLTNTGSLSLVVTTLADTLAPGVTTLRQALANAAMLGGNLTVSFAAGLTGSIALSSGLEISSNVTIAGPGAVGLKVLGGGPSSDFNVFTVDGSVTATISGLTIAGGNSSSVDVGGGLLNFGMLTLSGDVFSGNTAGYGGGIFNAGSAVLLGCTLSGNSATNSAGAVYNYDSSTLTMINDTVTGNSAYYGGAVFNTGAVTLTNVTIAANSTTSGGALYNYGSGSVTLNNTIVANGVSGGDIAGAVSGSSNLIDDAATAGGLSNGVSGNLVGVSALLGLLGSYGGPTETLPLLPGSPAIDSGNTALAVDTAGNPLTTDQRGMARVIGTAVDIGAFESSGFTLTVIAGNNQSAPPGGAFATALQVHVIPVNASDPVDGGTITFSTPASTGASATLDPSNPVTISKGAATVSATADDNPGGTYSIVASSSGVAVPVSFSLTNLMPVVMTCVASLPSPVYGQSLSFSVAVSPSSEGQVPGGSIQFQVDGVSLGQAVSLVDGTATSIATSRLGAGEHTVTVVYSGDIGHPGNSVDLSLPVAKALLTVTADAKSKVYGAAVPVLTATMSGFVNGDTTRVISGAPALTTSATSASHVSGGPYPITVGAGTLQASNYSFTFVNGTMTVTPAPLTITANNATKMVGAPIPPLSVSYSGFVNGDSPASLTTKPTVTPSASSLSPSGSYPIVPAGASSPDYTITYKNGVLIITPAPVTVLRVSIQAVRLGKAKKTTQVIVLQFSGALAQASADLIRNYSLATIPSGKKQESKPVALSQATYNATNNTVTLVTRNPLVLNPPLKLTVNAGGLLDMLGRPIDGDGDGQPGGNYVTTLHK